LPPDAVRWLAAGVAEALAAIHGVGLVHRDLTPGNILVTLDGPKVIDFGLALADDQSTVNMVGTVAYMAPEQAEGESGSHESDVYAMGATLLFAGTGHAPYQGTAIRVLNAVRNREPDLTGLPDALLPLVESCLRRRASRRPAPGDVIADFGRLLAGRERAHEAAAWLPVPVLELLYEHERRIRPSVAAPGVVPTPVPRSVPSPASAAKPVGVPAEVPAPVRSRPTRPPRPSRPPAEPTIAPPTPERTRRYTEDPYSVPGASIDRIVYAPDRTGGMAVFASSLGSSALRMWREVLAPLVHPLPRRGFDGTSSVGVRFGALAGRPTLIHRSPTRAYVLIAPAGSTSIGPRHALALSAGSTDALDADVHPGARLPRLESGPLDAETALREGGLRARARKHADVLVDVLAALLTWPGETFALSEADGVADPSAVLWGVCDLLTPLLPAAPTFSTLTTPERDDGPQLVVHELWPEVGAGPGRRHRIVPGEDLYSMGDTHRAAAEALVRCHGALPWAEAAARIAPLSAYRSAAPTVRSEAVLRALEKR
jgi:hypothetical protein